jgi:HD-like signal output (HDOD) protein
MIPAPLEAKEVKTWVDFIKSTDIPVLKQTARELGRLQQDEDKLSARALSSAVINDPMMVFRVLCYSQNHKGKHQLQDLLQVEQAILMMGCTTFFRDLTPKFLVEDALKSDLVALTHLLKLIRRAHRAAHFAADFATHLADMHAEEVHIAALLHDLAEMLMWCFAPAKMMSIFNMQHADKTLRSHVAQEQVLGFKLHDLQKALVLAFRLPPLLTKLMEDEAANEHRVKNVILAVNLARHSTNGWDDAALPDDYSDIAEFLRMDVNRAKRIIGVPAEALNAED